MGGVAARVSGMRADSCCLSSKLWRARRSGVRGDGSSGEAAGVCGGVTGMAAPSEGHVEPADRASSRSREQSRRCRSIARRG